MSGWLTWITEPLSFEFYRRAMAVSAMIGATGGLLSACVVVRRSALIVEALTHSLLPGLALAVLIFGLSPFATLVGGTVSSLAVALGALLLARRARLSQDSSFALLFLLAISAGLLLLSVGPAHGDIEQYLLGNIIGIADGDIILAFAVCSMATLVVVALQRPLAVSLFDAPTAVTLGIPVTPVHAVLVTLVVLVLIVAVQAAGILLAVGFLVLPATAVLPFARSVRQLALGACLLGGLLPPPALIVAYWLDLPPGPSIIALMAGIALISQLLRPGIRSAAAPLKTRDAVSSLP